MSTANLMFTFCYSNSDASLDNFSRLKPTLKLLGISLDKNATEDLIQEKEGAAAHLLYQLYFLLENREKAESSRPMREVRQSRGRALLQKKEPELFSSVRFSNVVYG